MKLLIIGASGVLGSKLYNDAVRRKWNGLGTYHSKEYEGLYYLDLKEPRSVNKIFNFFEPEVVVLAGGLTDVDMCELKPKLCRDINIKGTINVVKKVKELGAKLVYVSTDYVFDGTKGPYKEVDTPHPINVYGKSKLEAELIVKAQLKDYLIVRTAQLYGLDPQGRNFAIKIINNLRNKKYVYAADDFYCTPTYSANLSECIIQLIEKYKNGLYHAAGTDFINRYEYASKIAGTFDFDKDLVKKVKLKDLNLKARRPERAGLKADKIVKEINVTLLNCDNGLRLFKEEMQ